MLDPPGYVEKSRDSQKSRLFHHDFMNLYPHKIITPYLQALPPTPSSIVDGHHKIFMGNVKQQHAPNFALQTFTVIEDKVSSSKMSFFMRGKSAKLEGAESGD